MALPDNPITREEMYLSNIAGEGTQLPDHPVTRVEQYLEYIANNGGGGGGTTNYEALSNKPQVNGTTLSGNKTSADLGLQDELTFDATPTESSTNPVTSGGVYGALETKADASELETTKTATGSIVTVEDAAPINAEDVTVQIEPVQSGSGDPSPTNVRPISGFDEVEVTRTGFNVWDEEWEVGALVSDGSVDASLTDRRTTSFIQVQAGETYYQKSPQNAMWGRYAFYDKNKNCIYYNANGFAYYFTAQENAKYIRITFNASYGTTYNHDISINYPSTDTEYHPYAGTTYTVTLPDTIYGGTLDVTTGLLTVDRVEIASYAGETLAGEWISDRDTYQAGETPTTGAQVVYELATPQTYQLTPTQVKMLLNYNNIWANSGDTTLEYQPNNVVGDIKGEIEKLTDVPTEDGTYVLTATVSSGVVSYEWVEQE